MGNVGLLYVGAVLFINGLALMGIVKGTGATPLNWFVGLLQVVTPTVLIIMARGDADQIFHASGLGTERGVLRRPTATPRKTSSPLTSSRLTRLSSSLKPPVKTRGTPSSVSSISSTSFSPDVSAGSR